MAPKWFATTPDSDYMYKALTDGTISNMSGGRIPKLTPAQAAGLIGSWVIESGRSIQKGGFKNFDVVEAGTGNGRGISQYTGVRRGPYDKVAAEAQARGENINSAQWQMQYFVNEYLGKYDHLAGGSLVGYRKDFDPAKMAKNKFGDTPAGWARYFTGSAQEGFGYFRPGKPHQNWRNEAANEVFKAYQNIKEKVTAPKSTAPAAGTQQGGASNFLQDALKKLGIKGGSQSFNTDKLQRVVGAIAANTPVSDIGLAIFASQKGVKNPQAAWKNLDNNTRKAYGRAGAALAINTNPGYQVPRNPYSMPKSLSIGSGSQNYKTNVGPKATFDSKIDLSRNSTTSPGPRDIGGLPSLGDIAQAGIANYSYFKNKSSSYGMQAYNMGGSTIGRINSASYGTSLDLGKSLGISGSAAGAAARAGGSAYGGTAFSSGFNAGSIAASSYGYSQ